MKKAEVEAMRARRWMNIIILQIIIIYVFISLPATAGEIDITAIQQMISRGQHQQARQLLEDRNLEGNPDLQYLQALLWGWDGQYQKALEGLYNLKEKYPNWLEVYDQLARIHSWRREFDRAAELVEQAQSIEASAHRTALLARHAEWQERWFRARNLWEQAREQAESADIKEEYRVARDRVQQRLEPHSCLRFSARYNEEFEGYLMAGKKWLPAEGVRSKLGAGPALLEGEPGLALRGELTFVPVLFAGDVRAELVAELLDNQQDHRYTYNGSITYYKKESQRLVFDLESVIEEDRDYQTVTAEYVHDFEEITLSFKNIARYQDGDWNGDFSQQMGIYYPRDRYVLNLQASYYEGGDYGLRLGVEMSDLQLAGGGLLHRWNSWLNKEGVFNLDLEVHPDN